MRRTISMLAFIGLLTAPVFADAGSRQIAALWAKMATVPDLKAVDQIIIEGDASQPTVRGTLFKMRWMQPNGEIKYKPFWARFEQRCSFDIPQCFKVKSIWSRGDLLAGE